MRREKLRHRRGRTGYYSLELHAVGNVSAGIAANSNGGVRRYGDQRDFERLPVHRSDGVGLGVFEPFVDSVLKRDVDQDLIGHLAHGPITTDVLAKAHGCTTDAAITCDVIHGTQQIVHPVVE